ncbi:MAG: NAD(P)H-dependent oxidoreductase [Sneathiella sp.]|nr:NAD(P)H-dependent oxidoreductase [Sneathiella sp.]
MKKRILLVNGNPKERSFTGALANTYKVAAEENYEIRYHQLAKMDFDPNLMTGYDTETELEEDLRDLQDSILWSDHIVIFTPVWWGSVPAKLKGMFDRTFLPGFAFKYESGKSIPEKLLKNKSARIVLTMDTPPWYFRFFQGAPALKQLKIATLKFSGYTKIRHNLIGPIMGSNEEKQAKWLERVRLLGQKGQ